MVRIVFLRVIEEAGMLLIIRFNIVTGCKSINIKLSIVCLSLKIDF